MARSGCRKPLPRRCEAAKFGRIVNIASGAGLRPSLTGIQAYTAAKHALVGLTKQLSQDLGPFGITCNAIAPGFVRSNPASERQWQSYGAEGQARLVESIHTRRLGTADDIAAAALFLASDRASWITGSDYVCRWREVLAKRQWARRLRQYRGYAPAIRLPISPIGRLCASATGLQ